MGAQGRYESIAIDFKEETLPSGDAKSNLSSEHDIDQSPNHDNRLMSAEESLGKEDLETRLPFASPIRFHGWRGGIAFALLITALAFLTNFVLLIWLAARHTFQNGLTTTYSGSCSHVQSLNVWAHLGINAVSTLMLGASSYCMQCVSSPTREEVDNAHAERRWLDIGVPGIRNLGSIAPYKRWLWALLAISSIPLHLLYNSTFYAALSSNDYRIFVVTPEFVRGTVNLAPDALQGSYNFTPNHEVDFRNNQTFLERIQSEIGGYQRLENADCITEFAQDFVSTKRELFIVSTNTSTEYTVLASDTYLSVQYINPLDQYYRPYGWICNNGPHYQEKVYSLPELCSPKIPNLIADAANWKPYGHQSSYCLVKNMEETCSYNANLAIMIVVVICNLIKLVIMALVVWQVHNNPLITIGDAISSFLTVPDETTVNLCLLSKRDVVSTFLRRPKSSWIASQHVDLGRHRWFRSASLPRWIITIGLLTVVIIVVSMLLTLPTISLDSQRIRAFGFGQINGQALVTGWSIQNIRSSQTRISASVLVANLPQLVLSIIYFALNGLLTSLFVAKEWDDFSEERKPLRVSNPAGEQRSSYFLQLPYKVAVPMLTMSGLLHWLISQSIFLAVVQSFTADGELLDPNYIATCGYSPIAIMCGLVLGGLIMIGVVLLGLRRLRGHGMPVAGSCSAAISASCHAANWDEPDAALKPLQWGVINPGSGIHDEPRHCSFSSGPVEIPVTGRLYAGGRRIANTDK